MRFARPVPAFDPVAITDRAADLVAEQYLFPDVGDRVAELLRARRGQYSTAATPESLAAAVTADLQSVNGDRHLRLKYSVDPLPEDTESDDAVWAALWAAQAKEAMGGVRRVERRPGNVGLLELAPLLFPAPMAGPAIAAAFALLADVDALVIDLRAMRGGDPGTVALICSYLLAEPTHLNSMRTRGDERETQSWTLPWVPGRRLPDVPVWVVTGPETFSGGEELAYDLQQLGRATIVGAPTGGGAHAREGFVLHPHLELTLPVVRAVNPVSGTNWEGVGVQPDVPADDALATAEGLARAAVAARDGTSPALRRELAAGVSV